MPQHRLVGNDNPNCVSHAIFDVLGDKVHVLALIGATRYVDRYMTVEQARKQYVDLRKEGWLEPTVGQTNVMPRSRLRALIYD